MRLVQQYGPRNWSAISEVRAQSALPRVGARRGPAQSLETAFTEAVATSQALGGAQHRNGKSCRLR